MTYGISVLVSDIPANLEVGLSKERYFKCGDMDDLREKIDYHLANPISPDEKSIFRSRIEETYNWTKIAISGQIYQPWKTGRRNGNECFGYSI
jgi:hypothetical protein